MSEISIRKLSPALAKVAADELFEVPERIQDEIAALRSWMQQSKHINGRQDDQFLIGFLRGCKYSRERAKYKIEKYYAHRSAMPEFYANRDPALPLMQEIISHGLIMPLPCDESSPDPRIVLVRLGAYDYNKYNFLDLMKVTYLMADSAMIDSDCSIVNGHITVTDLKDCGLGLLAQVTPTVMK